jgi:hypothetical protein
MPWHDEETVLGPRQKLTREGFLLCGGVPLARAGRQLYHASELPNLGQRDGWISVAREPSEVFHPDSIRSFQGRPLVDEHPADVVDPDNHAGHAIGVVTNVRRGGPPDDDVLLGDLLVTARRGIALIRGGKRAVSVGYSADYARDADGIVRQRNIVVNHVALVNEGRCGPRCSIGDSKGNTKMVRDEHSYYVSGATPTGTAGSLVSSQAVGPTEVLRLPGISAVSLEVYQDGPDAVVVKHGNVSGMSVGYGARPIRPASFEEKAERAGRSSFGLSGDATSVRLALLEQTRPRMTAWQRANDSFWSRR